MRNLIFFFFSSRRRHTRLQGDWSSDVCSSDLDAPRNVLALEADQIDALAVLGQEAADRLVGIGRLQELDVADARREDRVLESELPGLGAMMDLQPEETREPLDRGVQVAHHDGQLDDVTQHRSPPRE